MKRIFIIITGLISLICLCCCSNSNKQNYHGTYTFKEVSYLSPLSSSTIDYTNEHMAGTKYIIETDLFKIESTDSTVEISSPNYVKEEITKKSAFLSDIHSIIGNEALYQYTIYNKDGNKTHWRLYVSSDCIWAATYADNTINGSEVIMRIDKLSK
ncbi:MAG: hypothetical protein WCQ54_12415 [Clostridiaceae bacterium]